MGPIGAARVGYIDGAYVLNPKQDQLPNSQLELVVAGTAEGVLMVESEAKELSRLMSFRTRRSRRASNMELSPE